MRLRDLPPAKLGLVLAMIPVALIAILALALALAVVTGQATIRLDPIPTDRAVR